jgi:hypothetical protein
MISQSEIGWAAFAITPAAVKSKTALAIKNGHLGTFQLETSFMLALSEKCRRSASWRLAWPCLNPNLARNPNRLGEAIRIKMTIKIMT